MSGCREWQERIALAAGGDLGEADREALDLHMHACPECAAELDAMQRSMAVIREAHEEPVAEAHFAAVRARVMARIDGERRWRWAWAAVLTAAAVAGIVWLRPAPVPAPPVIAVAAPPPRPPAAVPRATPKRSQQPRAHHAVLPVRQPAPVVREPVVVKLLTDDPNVVIYWIGDGQ